MLPFLRNIPPKRKRGRMTGLEIPRAKGNEEVEQDMKYPYDITVWVINSRIPIAIRNLVKIGLRSMIKYEIPKVSRGMKRKRGNSAKFLARK